MGKNYGVPDYLLSKAYVVLMALMATPTLTPTLWVLALGAKPN